MAAFTSKRRNDEYAVMPPAVIDGARHTLIKHRRSYKLFFFNNPDLSDKNMFYAAFLSEVHWLEKAYFKIENQKNFGVEFIREGSLYHRGSGKEQILRRGDLLIIHEGANSEIRTGPDKYCKKTSLLFAGDFINKYLEFAGLSGKTLLHEVDTYRLEALLERYKELSMHSTSHNARQNEVLTLEFFQFLQKPRENLVIPENFAVLPKYFEANLEKDINNKDLAKRMGYSEAYFIREFKKYFKLTPRQMLINLRLQRAAVWLLSDVIISIKEIALMVGYSDALNFSTEFKKKFGLSPRAYRQQKDF